MPIYDYQCEKCGHEFEREQRMSDAHVKICPQCKARKVKRLISRGAFHLKGGGWYKDGYTSGKPEASTPSKAPSPCDSCPSKAESA